MWNMRVTAISIVVDELGKVPKGSEKKNGGNRNQKNLNHPDHSIIKISLNRENSGNLSRLAVTQIPLKDRH